MESLLPPLSLPFASLSLPSLLIPLVCTIDYLSALLIKSNQNSSHLNLKTLKIFCFLSILVSNIKSICSLGRPGMSLSHLRDQALVGQLKFSPAKGRPCPRQSLTCLLFVISDEPHSGLRLTSPALPHSQSSTEET